MRKPTLRHRDRLVRLLGSVVDPRAWSHLVRLLNHYNHAHVRPRRQLRHGRDLQVSPTATFAHAERIVIGDRVLIGEDCRLWAGPSVGCIRIGHDTMLGPGVLLTAASYRYGDGAPISAQHMAEADVIVGADVWIGARAVLLPGCVVGDGSIIGAGAVVRGCIPPGCIAVGVPARVIASRTTDDAGRR